MNQPSETPADAARRVALAEDLTIYNAAALKAQLLETIGVAGELELDLSAVGEIDTSGVQLLILAKREAARQQRALRIVAHSSAVRDAIEFFNLAAYFGDPLLIPAREAA